MFIKKITLDKNNNIEDEKEENGPNEPKEQ